MSQHIYAHEHPESETDRGGGFTLWFTGLSGSGKTTIAHHVGPELDDLENVRSRRGAPYCHEAIVGVIGLPMTRPVISV